MIRQPVLMIVGKAGSGKDTLASMIKDLTGATIVSLADPLKRIAKRVFPQLTDEQLWGPSEKRGEVLDNQTPALDYEGVAGTVYTELHFSFAGNVDLYHIRAGAKEWLDSLKMQVLTPRLILQTLGTEFVRKLKDDVWIRRCADIASTVTYPHLTLYKKSEGLVYLPSQETVKAIVPDGRFINEAQGARDLGWFTARIRRPGAAGSTMTHSSETEQDGIPDNLIDFEVDNSGDLEDLRVMKAWRVHSAISTVLKNQKREAMS